MKKIVVILGVLLIVSNLYWLYALMDNGITLTYRDQELHEYKETQKQLMSMLTDVAKNRSEEEIIEIAKKYTSSEPFEKEGCTWVGWLGFKFAENSELEGVSWVISYGEGGPCHEAF
ncbi:hypothetical protein [Microbulbifer sp. ALW1]|uniref:hypothetical protein n=1 Tax=Microbulbifer sp. (strain ALW1) TaxID=1516059 RepID=UPI001357C668|nr:hypothetical protein [Microbulbifer sp. ALW1]